MEMITITTHICQYQIKGITNYSKTILSQVCDPLFSLAKLENLILNKTRLFNNIKITYKSSVKKLRATYLSFFCLRVK